MSQYRFLQDAYIGTQYYLAGTTATTADIPGGTLPIDWVPGPYVDPLDTAAVNAFYAAVGPNIPVYQVLVRPQWSTIPVFSPTTYWRQLPYGQRWQLTGLGAGLPPIGV